MIDYTQPSFYHFSQDSIELSKFVISSTRRPEKILDLGAGCGVIGIEIAKALGPQELLLVELQEEYRPFLNRNVELFVPTQTKSSIEISSFSNWNSDLKFDVIVCNPPYYLPGRGQESTNLNKARARSFIQDDWKKLLQITKRNLSSDGRAFFVVKNEDQILKAVQEGRNNLNLMMKQINSGTIAFLVFSHLD
jgi:tRNA1Val (adenine37-N6)-methyltransferase